MIRHEDIFFALGFKKLKWKFKFHVEKALTYYTTQYRVSKCGRTARAIVLLHHIHLDPRRVCNHTKTGKKRKKKIVFKKSFCNRNIICRILFVWHPRCQESSTEWCDMSGLLIIKHSLDQTFKTDFV